MTQSAAPYNIDDSATDSNEVQLEDKAYLGF